MQGFAFSLYVTAVGFVTAGVLASFAQLVSGEPLRFGIEARSLTISVIAVFLCALAGPEILMRNSWRAAKARSRSPVWLGLRPDCRGLEFSVGLGSSRPFAEDLSPYIPKK